MRRRHLFQYIILLLSLFFANNMEVIAQCEIVPDEIIVNFKEGITDFNLSYNNEGVVQTGITSIDSALAKHDVYRMIRLFPGSEQPAVGSDLIDVTRFYSLKFRGDSDLRSVFKEFEDNPYVEHVEFDSECPMWASPNDPAYTGGHQWNLDSLEMPDAWDIETGSSGVILAIIDGGIQWYHDDLEDNLWINSDEYYGTQGQDDDGNDLVDDIRGWDWIHFTNPGTKCWSGEDCEDEDNDPDDFANHGTTVAGVAAARTHNLKNVAGIAGGWNTSTGCLIMNLRAGYKHISGAAVIKMSWAAAAIDYARQKGAKVINCSWGSDNTGGLPTAVWNAVSDDIVIVNASGNENSTNADYLASTGYCIDVSATDINDERWDDSEVQGSNYGSWLDVSAPGVSVSSTNNQNSHGNNFTGTSLAAPHVTGLAGLIRSQFSSLDRNEVRDVIRFSAEKVDSMEGQEFHNEYGYGRINAKFALAPPSAPYQRTIAGFQGQNPRIRWYPSPEPDIKLYKIYQKVPGAGTYGYLASVNHVFGQSTYQYTDNTVTINRFGVGNYYYKIKAEDYSEQLSSYSNVRYIKGDGPVAKLASLPQKFALHENSPNPFNPNTTIRYELPEESSIELKVYDLMGREIRKLVTGNKEAGYGNVMWDGKDSYGNPVSSGMYLYRIDALSYESDKEFHQTRKMVLLR